MGTAKRRILVVDDEPVFTRMLKLALEDTGAYQVRVENHGAQVFAALEAFHPDLILLDIVMPDLDGATVASQLKGNSRFKDLPIIFLTAVLSKEEAVLRSGIVSSFPLVTKPVNLDDLIQTIQRMVRQR